METLNLSSYFILFFRLKDINATMNKLQSISFPDTSSEEKTPLFPALTSLIISENPLEEASALAVFYFSIILTTRSFNHKAGSYSH